MIGLKTNFQKKNYPNTIFFPYTRTKWINYQHVFKELNYLLVGIICKNPTPLFGVPLENSKCAK